MKNDRPLTPKERKVIDTFPEHLQKDALENMRSPNTGWAEATARMDNSEIQCKEGSLKNSFSYRHIGQ